MQEVQTRSDTRASRAANRWMARPTAIINAIAAPTVTHTGHACESNVPLLRYTQHCSCATKTIAASINPRKYSRLQHVGNFSNFLEIRAYARPAPVRVNKISCGQPSPSIVCCCPICVVSDFTTVVPELVANFDLIGNYRAGLVSDRLNPADGESAIPQRGAGLL